MAKYLFPAVFECAEDGVNVTFPDIENCFTCGQDREEAVKMAQDVLPLMLCEMEDNHEPIPKPSNIRSLQLKDNEFTSYILADTSAYRAKYNSKAVKKTVSIPAWLNEAATQKGINFSQTLQEALKEKIEA